MAADWHATTIGEVAEIFDGPHATPPKTDHGPVFLGIASLTDGRIDVDKSDHVSEEYFAKWTRRVVPQPGDVVFSYETRLGEAALIPEGLRCCLGRRMGLLRLDRNKVDPQFMLYAYLAQDFQDTLRARTIHGSTVDRIPLNQMASFPITLPPLDEQKRIAHILGTLDDKIELNLRMSETLEEMARALFKSWFVDFDPVRAKAEGRDTGLPKHLADLFPDRLVDSALGEIPEGWQIATVAAQCSQIYSGGTPATQVPGLWDGGVPWLSSGETRSWIISTTERTISERGIVESSTRRAPRLATVIASAGQGRTRGQTSLLGLDCYINQSIVALVADPTLSSASYLYFDLERRYEQLRQASDSQSSRGSLTTRILAGLPAILPQRSLIAEFSARAGALVERSLTLATESQSLASLRDASLKELIY